MTSSPAINVRPTRRSVRSRSASGLPTPVVDAVSAAVVAVTVVVSLAWPTAAAKLALPFAILAVVLGVPHGAADGAILATASSTAGRRAGWVYLVVFVAVGAAVWLVTVPAVLVLLVLLVLAVVHFGLGEVEYADATTGATTGAGRTRSWERAAGVVGAGGVVVAVPFAVHPHPVDAVLRALDPALVTALSPGIRWTAAAVAVACLLVTAVVKVSAGQWRRVGRGCCCWPWRWSRRRC